MCCFLGPAPNRSVREFTAELPFWISTFIRIPKSMYIDLKDGPTPTLSAVKLCAPIGATNAVVLYLEIGSPTKSTVVLSTFSCLRDRIPAWGFWTRYRAARISGARSNFRGSHSLGHMFLLLPQGMREDLYRVAYFFLRDGLCLPSNTNLSCKFFRGAHFLGVRAASRFFDDEWCEFQVRCPV